MTSPGMSVPGHLAIEKLNAGFILGGFDCGHEELNRFLILHALAAQKANSAQTYVAHRDGRVVGYHTLVAGSVEHSVAPERIRKGLARHPIPVMVLARLAVNLPEQGKGLGAALLKDALLRTASAARIAGIRALLVHAKDEQAASFYRRFDFDPAPFAPNMLFLLMKDLERLLV